MNQPIRKAFYI